MKTTAEKIRAGMSLREAMTPPPYIADVEAEEAEVEEDGGEDEEGDDAAD